MSPASDANAAGTLFADSDASAFPRRAPSRDARSAAAFSCLLAVSVFLAMCGLWFWHVYLVLTAQTSIDYHRFAEKRKEARRRGETYANPHDRGWRRNWQDVFDERGAKLVVALGDAATETAPRHGGAHRGRGVNEGGRGMRDGRTDDGGFLFKIVVSSY